MDMVEILGKRDRKVPVLIAPDVKDSMDALLHFRTECGVKSCNRYFFATNRDGHLNSWKVLNECAKKANLANPSLISSTRLRKYIATMCQVFVHVLL